MRNDEFNHVEVTNDKQIRGVEFGKTFANEYSFQRDNVVNKNELNKQVKNELNEGANSQTQRSHKQEGLTKEQIEQLESSGTSSASATESAVSSATSAATASSSAATVAGTAAVSASAVVVTAFTVITAAPIIISKATANLIHFENSENEVFYEIELLDTIETESYRVILSCEGFVDYKELEPGINSGQFFDLKENTEYQFVVEEGTDVELKRTLLSKSFVTSEGILPISEFRSFDFNQNISFLDRKFTIQLDFIDEQEIYSDFAFTLTSVNSPDISRRYELEKSLEIQTFTIDSSFDLEENLKYTLTYKERDIEVIFEENTFYFNDTSGAISEFRGGTVDTSADFLNGTISVTLDYQDDFDILSDFELVMYNDEMGESNARRYALEKSTSPQSISIKSRKRAGESDLVSTGLDLENGPFNYYFSYSKKGEVISTETNEITFEDTSGAESVFNGGTISNEADFLEETFVVTLDYVDDFNCLDDIALVIYGIEAGEENARTFNLSKELTSQTISAKAIDDLPPLDLEADTFVYYFTYTRKGIAGKTDNKEVTFVDYEDRKTAFNDFVINNKADFVECTFNVQLDYIDDYSRLDNFILHVNKPNADSALSFSREYPLEKVTTVQTLSSNESDTDPGFDLEDGPYEYYLTYTHKGVSITTDTKEISFSDVQDRMSVFNGITINQANFDDQTFDVTLDFVDDFNRFSNFHITLIDETQNLTTEYDLENSTDTQSFSAGSIDDPDYVLDLEHSSLKYELTYEERGEEKTVSDSTTFIDKNGLTSGINNFEFTTDDSGKVLIKYGSFEFETSMQFVDYFGYYNEPQIEFSRTIREEKVSYQVDLDRVDGAQTLYVTDSADFESFLDDQPVDYSLTYLNRANERVTLTSGSITFTDSSVSQINNIEVGKLIYDGSSYYLGYRVDFVDEKDELENLSFYIGNEDVEDTYLVQLSETGNYNHDTYWQVAYFSTNLIDDLLAKTATIKVKKQDTPDETVIYSKEVDLELDSINDPLQIYGVRINSYVGATSDQMDSFTIHYFAYNGDNTSQTVNIKFVNSNGVEYLFEGIELKPVGQSITVSVDSTTYADFISDVNAGFTFDVYVIYTSGSETKTVLCYTAFSFVVS